MQRSSRKKPPKAGAQPDLLVAIALLLLATTFVVFALSPAPSGKPAAYPAWWFERDVILRSDTNVTNPAWPTNYLQADDYATLNAGQLKTLASRAYDELQARLSTNIWSGSTNAPGPKLVNLISTWSTNTSSGDNYAVVNQGQLKNIAKHFYDVLAEAGYVAGTNVTPAGWTNGTYPWSSSTNSPDAYAAANIGQAKYLFSFDVVATGGSEDSDEDGLPDAWEMEHFGHLDYDGDDDPDGDGVSNLDEYLQGRNPVKGTQPGGSDVDLQVYSIFEAN